MNLLNKTTLALVLVASMGTVVAAEELVVYRSRDGWHNYPTDEDIRIRYLQDAHPEYFQNRKKLEVLKAEYDALSETWNRSKDNKKLIEPKLTEARDKFVSMRFQVDQAYNNSRIALRDQRLRGKYSALAEIAINDPKRSFTFSQTDSGYERLSSTAELEKLMKITHDPYNTQTVLFQKATSENPWGSSKVVTITAGEKEALNRAFRAYNQITEFFKSGTPQENYLKFTMMHGHENPLGIKSPTDLSDYFKKLSKMRENIYYAKNVDELLKAADRLESNSEKTVLAINEFKSKFSSVKLTKDGGSQLKEGHQVKLNRFGKVTEIVQKSGTSILGKAGLLKAVAALGLGYAVSAQAEIQDSDAIATPLNSPADFSRRAFIRNTNVK